MGLKVYFGFELSSIVILLHAGSDHGETLLVNAIGPKFHVICLIFSFNSFMLNVFYHSYQLDESIFNLGLLGGIFHLYLK